LIEKFPFSERYLQFPSRTGEAGILSLRATISCGIAGDREPSTTKLYDRRVYNPENAALFLQRIEFSIARPAGMIQTVQTITRSIVKGEAAL
jgi:hypothetical protein